MKSGVCNTIHEQLGALNIPGIIPSLTDADLEKIETQNGSYGYAQGKKDGQAFFKEPVNRLEKTHFLAWCLLLLGHNSGLSNKPQILPLPVKYQRKYIFITFSTRPGIQVTMKEKLIEYYDGAADKRDKWKRRNRLYHKTIQKYYRFTIPENSSVAEIGCGTGDLLNAVKPQRGLGIDFSEEMLRIAREKYPALEFRLADEAQVAAGGEDSRLVDQVLQVRTDESRGQFRQICEVNACSQGLAASVDTQNRFARLHVGPIQDNLAIEASRPQQGRVQHVGSIGSGYDDDVCVRAKTVHFDQNLVQRLLAFVVATPQAHATTTTHGIYFVYKDHSWGLVPCALEQVAHSGCTHANEHFDELGA